MRKIYESSAVRRDNEDHGSPNERDEKRQPQAMRSVPSSYLSRVLVPHRLRHWSVAVDVSTPRDEYERSEGVPFIVTMKNVMPFPVTIPTQSPLLWTWAVDGAQEGSRVELRNPPDEERGFHFDRGERRQFRRRWGGMFRVSETEWEPATAGEYTISAGINVEDPEGMGLYDETTITLLD